MGPELHWDAGNPSVWLVCYLLLLLSHFSCVPRSWRGNSCGQPQWRRPSRLSVCQSQSPPGASGYRSSSGRRTARQTASGLGLQNCWRKRGRALEPLPSHQPLPYLLGYLPHLDLGRWEKPGALHREDAAPQGDGERIGEGDVGCHILPHNSLFRNLEEQPGGGSDDTGTQRRSSKTIMAAACVKVPLRPTRTGGHSPVRGVQVCSGGCWPPP